MRVSSPVTKSNPRPRKYPTAAARQAAYRSRNEMLEFRAEPKTAETLTRIADTIDVSRSDLLLSMVKFALANHDWARFGLTHKTIPFYEGNPIMATRKPTAKQLEARARFAEMARTGAFKKKRKTNPRKKTVSQKISQLVHEGYPQKQAVAVALSEQRAGKVKRNPAAAGEQHQKMKINLARAIAKKVLDLEKTHSYSYGPFDYEQWARDYIEEYGFFIPYNASADGDDIRSIKNFSNWIIRNAKIDQIKEEAATIGDKRKTNPAAAGEQHLFGNKYATIRQQGDGRYVAQVYEKIKTGAGEEIDLWGFKIYKTHAGAQRYLDSLKPVKNNPTEKRKVSAVVLMKNPRAKKPKKIYTVSIMQTGLHDKWMGLGNFFTFAEAENYAHYLAKQHPDWAIRVHDNRAM